jgi:hypothetical protein
METKDLSKKKEKTVIAVKDGKKVFMTEAHFKCIQKKGWVLDKKGE